MTSGPTPRRDRTYYDPYYDDPFFYREHYYHEPSTGSTTHSVVPIPTESHPIDAPAEDGTFSGGADFASDDSTHDPADFTEGDAESVRNEGDDHFETDMGGS
jgi:hypothetical protein